jgi:hypothetical protein
VVQGTEKNKNMKQALALLAAASAVDRSRKLVAPALETAQELTIDQAHALVAEALKLQCAALEVERIALGIPAPLRG